MSTVESVAIAKRVLVTNHLSKIKEQIPTKTKRENTQIETHNEQNLD